MDMRMPGPGQTPIVADGPGYTEAFFNKRHSTGGVYHQMGGNLKQKKIGNFPGIGINAAYSKAKGTDAILTM